MGLLLHGQCAMNRKSFLLLSVASTIGCESVNRLAKSAPLTIEEYVGQMVEIPGGGFWMGNDNPDKAEEFTDETKNQSPMHYVELSSFKFGSTPVTVAMWRQYVKQNPKLSMPPLPEWDWVDDYPITNISWYDIMGTDGLGGYCKWASKVTGRRLMLPTEAHFEYASTGGDYTKYPWGDTFDKDKLWCDSFVPAPVVRVERSFHNKFGITDVVGNVKQWCWDWETPYKINVRDRLGYRLPFKNPIGPRDGTFCAIRGSYSVQADPVVHQCHFRSSASPGNSNTGIGFRVCEWS